MEGKDGLYEAASSLGSSEVEETEGVLEAAEVVISFDGPTFTEA